MARKKKLPKLHKGAAEVADRIQHRLESLTDPAHPETDTALFWSMIWDAEAFVENFHCARHTGDSTLDAISYASREAVDAYLHMLKRRIDEVGRQLHDAVQEELEK